MWISALTCTAILFVSHAPAPVAEDRVTYESARASAGRDPDAHVRLALWCEAHGMDAERAKHLAIALIADPDHALARGLLGLVRKAGGWSRPEEAGRPTKDEAGRQATLAEYRRRRDVAPETTDGQWGLALWCERHGMKAEATAHYWTVARLDPSRSDAWRKLGRKLHRGRWLTDAQIAGEIAESKARTEADKLWGPILEAAREQLQKPKHRVEAERTLGGIDDPKAIPSVWRVYGKGAASTQLVAVQLFGQIAAPDASRGLAVLAAYGRTPSVRRAAVEALARRDPREFADLLVGLLIDPIRYQVQPVGGPGSPGALLVKGLEFDLQRVYLAPPVTAPVQGRPLPGGVSENGRPMILRSNERSGLAVQLTLFGEFFRTDLIPYIEQRTAFLISESMKVAASSQQKLEDDVRAIEAMNASIHDHNAPVIGFLTAFSGRSLGEDPSAWRAWWIDGLGYAAQTAPEVERPVFTQTVTPDYVPEAPRGFAFSYSEGFRQADCFAAGTLVRTADGFQGIESIRVGDQVLSQDVTTGALSYQPVLSTFRTDRLETLRIRVGDETIASSRYHRFWRAGRGWALARELAVGDDLRTLRGRRAIESIEPGKTEPVFNLEIGGGKTFLVGKVGALVHDNTIPGHASEPFDAADKGVLR